MEYALDYSAYFNARTLVDKGYVDGGLVKVNPVTLIAASWTLVGNYYEYTYVNANILTTSFVTFVPNNASNLEVTSSKMLPQIDSLAGSCKFYTMFPPQSNIVGELIIQR